LGRGARNKKRSKKMKHQRTSDWEIKAGILLLIVGIVLIGCYLTISRLSKGIQILFIGNSYTFSNDLPEMFSKLAREGGHDVSAEVIANGGWTLEEHAQSNDTLENIQNGEWNYVILQEQSVIPSNPIVREQRMYPAVRNLYREIEIIGGSTILFMTWGRRDGLLQLGYRNYNEMQAELERGYEKIANELNITVSPVGTAWQKALEKDTQIDLWQMDGSHPSVKGTYLTACVFYAVIFQESPEGLSYMAGLQIDVGNLLQSVAAETVLQK